MHECMIKNSWNKTIQERELEQNMTRMECQPYLKECYFKNNVRHGMGVCYKKYKSCSSNKKSG